MKKRGAGASAPETSQERAVNRRKAKRTGLTNYWMGLSDQCHLDYRFPTEPPSERNTGEREREARSSIHSPRKLAHFSRLSTTLFSLSLSCRRRSLTIPSCSFLFLYFFFHCSIDDIFTSFVKGELVPSELSAPLWTRTLVDEAESRTF